MANRKMLWILVGACLPLLVGSGCATVTSSEPVGTEPVSLAEEEWEGTWRIVGSAGVVVVRVDDAENGVLELAGISEKDDQFQLEKMRCLIRKSGDWTFANLQNEENETYAWLRIEKSNHGVIGWLPDYERIGKLLDEDKLSGNRPEKNSIVLDELTDAEYEVLMDKDAPPCVDWENPLVLVRLRQQQDQ